MNGRIIFCFADILVVPENWAVDSVAEAAEKNYNYSNEEVR